MSAVPLSVTAMACIAVLQAFACIAVLLAFAGTYSGIAVTYVGIVNIPRDIEVICRGKTE